MLIQTYIFLRETQLQTFTTCLRLDSSKGDCGGKLSGLFTENGISGMTDGAYYVNIDQVSHFLRKIVETMSGNSDSAPVTKVFTRYGNRNNNVGRRFCGPGWMEDDLNEVSNSLK